MPGFFNLGVQEMVILGMLCLGLPVAVGIVILVVYLTTRK